jgi:hypothetical protein
MHPNRLGGRLALATMLAVGSGAAVPVHGTVAAGESAAAVLDWNVNASTAIVSVAKQPPAAAILSYAMVQGAVYDAVNAIAGGYEPYLVAPASNGSESKAAAVSAAAHDVLVSLFPDQSATLDAQLAASLADIPDGAAETGGIVIGRAAAAAMIVARTNDGRFGPQVATPGTEPGEWRPDLPLFASDPVSWVANVRPFLLPRDDMFRSDGPNALTSDDYAADFAEVKSLGSKTSTTRTADQTDSAIWWQENGAALYNRILRTVVANTHLDIADAARLMAMTDLAGADSIISCFDDKYFWSFWRPITAIRQADTDGNPATDPDPTWLPLLNTPVFPDHPSGHGCEGSAIFNTLQAFYHTDKIAFSVYSNNSQTTRSFDRFSDAIKEVIEARIWGGIHFRTADRQGVVMGTKVSHWIVKHAFGPVG